MIKPKVNGAHVVLGPVRLSYAHVFEKFVQEGGSEDSGRYQTNFLVPKDEKETLDAIHKAIESAKKKGIAEKWGGKEPKKLDISFRDGDEKEDNTGVYENCFYANAKSNRRPQVVNRKHEPITDPEEVYSGCYAIISIDFYPYENSGNRGIACSLGNVMKWKDGEALGGNAATAEQDFDDIDDDIDDDDL
ncbi:MAG: DUF2815 family protein [Prevotella sp.]|nr:DUF2815 family protein [Prevotella sp.]